MSGTKHSDGGKHSGGSGLGVGPGESPGGVDLQRDVELGGMAHQVDDVRARFLALVVGHFEEYLVVDL